MYEFAIISFSKVKKKHKPVCRQAGSTNLQGLIRVNLLRQFASLGCGIQVLKARLF